VSKSVPIPVTLPVVPLLDISFQLMFFMVITFQTSSPEGQFALLLPKGGGGAPGREQDIEVMEVSPELVVTVQTDAGDLLHLAIRDGVKITEVADNAALEKALLAERRNRLGSALQIEAARNVRYARMVEVLDACHRAGYESISFAMAVENQE
jgi:biopolymer transport protein ExbD